MTLQCNHIESKKQEGKQQRSNKTHSTRAEFLLGLGYTDYWSNTACFHKKNNIIAILELDRILGENYAVSVIHRDLLHGSLA